MRSPGQRFAAPQIVTLLSGLAVIGLGAAVLVGWALGIDTLKSVLPGLVAMKANTACGMVLCGTALVLLSRNLVLSGARLVASAIAFTVIAFSLLTLGEDLFGLTFGIDQWLVSDSAHAVESPNPGRMSPASAFCFLLIGSALLVAPMRHSIRLRAPLLHALGTAVILIGGLGALGLVSAVLMGSRWWNYAGMAIHTAIGFVLLGAGVNAVARRIHRVQWSVDRLTTIGFSIGIASLIAATALSYAFTSQFRSDSAWVTHTQEVLKELQEVSARLADLESNQRGYLILGDENLLDDRPETATSLHTHLARLRDLTADNVAQQKRLDHLEPLVVARVDFGEQTIAVRRQQGFAAAQKLISTRIGIDLTGRLNRMLREMGSEEYKLLDERSGRSRDTATATFRVLPLGVFLSLTILLFGLSLLNFDAGERARTSLALRTSEQNYRQLIEQAADGIFVLDAEARFVFANTRALELLGYSEGELAGVDHAITYLPSDRQAMAERIAQVKTGALLRYERMVLRKDGSAFLAEFSTRLTDAGGAQVNFHDITERRRNETELRKSEEKFRQLIEQASDGIFISDVEGNYVLVNSRGCELLGYTHSEMLGMNGGVTYIDEEREVHSQRMRDVRAGQILRFERMVRRKDGSAFPAEISVKKLENDLVQVIFHDISERRNTQRTLLAERTLLRTLVDALPDVIFTKDHEGRFTMCNVAAYQNSGYAEEAEILGKTVFDLYPRPMAEQYHADDLAALSGHAIINREELSMDSHGVQRWFLTIKVPLRAAAGDIVGMIGVSRDITERRRTQEALLEERTLLRTLVDALPDIVFTKDVNGRFTMCNAAGLHHSGLAREADIMGKSVSDLYPREFADRYQADDRKVLTGESVINQEESGVDATGSQRWFLTIKVPLRDAAGNISGMVRVSRDISERREQEQKILRLNRVQAVLSGINSAIVRIRNRDELFHEACRIAAMHGAFRIAWIGLRGANGATRPEVWAGEGSEYFGESRNDIGATLSTRGVATMAMEEERIVVNNDIRESGSIDWIRAGAIERGCKSVIGLPLFCEEIVVGVLVLYSSETNTFDDKEELKLLEELAGDVSFALTFISQQEKVNYLAYYDTLTGLPNRTLFFDRLSRQLASAGRDAGGVALVILDVDRFRMVNETLGRHAGDALIKAIAERITASMRDEDTVTRLGADRFAIAASGAWRAQELAHLIESRNRGLFHLPFSIEGEELRVSATAGVAVFPVDAQNAEPLMANAEAALNSAKRQNVPLLFYGPEMNAQAAESLRMENRLKRALENDELALWYQPKIDVRTGKLTGFEALMRWMDPQVGMISPAKFIPVMEQTGLILDAGNWALSQVARDCATWQDAAKTALRIAVNVSPLQLRAKEFVANVIDAADGIEKTGGLLDLEITESVIMENVDAVIPKLQTVRGLGIHIYIDDFGTGYSSLAYIARLPIHALKIDRSFVVGMTQSEDAMGIVNSVVSLAHALKLRVVAEGVETEVQADLLRKLGCDEFQGYLFGKPVPSSEVPALLRKWS
jgi:diguanylate cyclase (GGDEF)-like protein/PAS domain S-box-containing protein